MTNAQTSRCQFQRGAVLVAEQPVRRARLPSGQRLLVWAVEVGPKAYGRTDMRQRRGRIRPAQQQRAASRRAGSD
jgi:hypothetical protein